MVLRRLFGHPDPAPAPATAPAGTPPPTASAAELEAETATVRKIIAQLDALPLDERKYIAGFAYILGRTANADLSISPPEVALMEKTVSEVGGLPEPQAILVVEMARNQAELYGGTEDYLVTREIARIATDEQKLQLVRTCFAVGAADGSISAEESAELNEIARELGLSEDQLRSMREDFKDQMAAIQAMRKLPSVSTSGGGSAA